MSLRGSCLVRGRAVRFGETRRTSLAKLKRRRKGNVTWVSFIGDHDMSKGLGRIERQVIELFDKQSRLKGSEVVTAIAGTTSTPSEKFAIRRALASLQGKGFLDKTSGPDGPRWARSEPGPADVDPLVLAIHQCEERLLAVARAKMVLREREAQLAACMASLRPR